MSARQRSALLALLATAACSSSSSVPATPDAAKLEPSPDAATHDGHVAHHDAGHDAHVTPHADAAIDTGTDALVVADVGGPTEAGKPPAPSGSATTSKAPLNFAIHHLWLGDSHADPGFTAPDAGQLVWSTFGYNIDGLITNEYSTDVCTPNAAAHATTAVQVDGVDGIDNSFGKNIVPTLATALPNISQVVSSAITDGSFTVLIRTTGLTASPTQTNTGLTGEIFSGASYGSAPPLSDAGAFRVTDDWPISSSSLRGDLDAGAVVTFPTAYVTNGLWVNGLPGEVTLVLVLQGQPLILDIHEAVISFKHTIDKEGQDHATGGTISGVLPAKEFLAEINEVAAEQMYCPEASLLLNFIAASADILHDGTNVKGQACDGISVGLEFDGDAIAEPSKVVKSVDAGNLPPPCIDAG